MDALGLGLAILAAAFSVAALVNLSDGASLRRVIAHGMFAGRSHFTMKGWRYKNISIALAILALIIFVGLYAID